MLVAELYERYPQLKTLVPQYCSHCDSELVINEKLTQLRCSNATCSRFLANRIEGMCKILGVKGFGEAICHNLVQAHGLTQMHQVFELAPETLTTIRYADVNSSLHEALHSRLEVPLTKAVRAMCLPGIASLSDKIFAGYSELEEFYQDFLVSPEEFIAQRIGKREGNLVQQISSTLLKSKPELELFISKFTLKRVASLTLNIAITESVNGYASKEAFIEHVNSKYPVNVVLKSQVTKDIFCLISENKAATTGKSGKAIKYGIPRYTSEEFMKKIEELINA